ADARRKEPTPEDPGDRWQEPARNSLLIDDLDLERASLDADHAFQPCQQLLHNEGLLRSLNLRDVVVHAGASAGERLVVVECPEDSDGNQAGHRLAFDPDVVIPHVDARRPTKPGRPLRRVRINLVLAWFSLLHNLLV